jgi:hypothetical protein
VTKVLQIGVLFLWLLCITLIVLLKRTPVFNGDVVMNETALMATVNHENLLSIKRYANKQVNETISQNERVLEAKKAITQILILTDSIQSHFVKLNEDIAIIDASNSRVQKIGGILNEIKAVVTANIDTTDTAGNGFWRVPKFSLSSTDTDLRRLEATGIEWEVYGLVKFFFNHLLAIVEVKTYKFDIWPPSPKEPFSIGLITNNAPSGMQLNKKERIQIRISRELKEDILESMSKKERVDVDTLMTGDIMTLKLIGEDFSITSYDEEEQGVTAEGFTQWEFDVIPKKTGKHQLLIKVGIVYFVPNLGSTKKFFPVLEKEIEVEVNAVEWIASFASERWEFLISTFVVPALVWSISRWKYRRRKESKQSETSGENGNH